MAPVLGLLRSMAERGVERKATFYYGARGSSGTCASRRSCAALEEQLPGFRYVPALSEPADDDEWDGETGLITDVVQRRTNPSWREWTPMSAVRRRWWTRRSPRSPHSECSEEHIFYDKFTTTGEPEGEDGQ